ncbi:DUF6456 domain-containing protein [Thalassobius sp. Cn5-15]|uniref:DUF6456 domain-containing protein n=1 Tax=Thalassobius sp. Cn5-15 TaxID=2917763 RepID=UPI001EF1D76E|nr:DUF6456 domain-containing protein [Thalassobius sp. Cn5-15]MCG7492126.1 DUF6456 domain-containing protein [Thalassobius sp. Cn5-15]
MQLNAPSPTRPHGAADPEAGDIPDWVPPSARLYLAHVEHGQPMRRLARLSGCHASTVMRQIRKLESQRDDVLVDLALQRLGTKHPFKEEAVMRQPQLTDGADAKTARKGQAFFAEAQPLLSGLAQKGQVLAVASDMEKAVLVDASGVRKSVVDRALAEALALRGWIECAQPGRVSRYTLSAEGRRQLTLNAATGPAGFAEAQAGFRTMAQGASSRPQPRSPYQDLRQDLRQGERVAHAETPLALLARRRDKSGQLFLGPRMVAAGERLREDFELASLRAEDEALWNPLAGGDAQPDDQPAIAAARVRIVRALDALGPGLADVALRCCCYLEGLEAAERHMGWSARSAKIVLRIALERLHQHYVDEGEGGALIG